MEFVPDSALINYAFDGYKLNQSGIIATKTVPLTHPVGINNKASMSLDLPFKILEDRARFNHLFVNPFDDSLFFYIIQQAGQALVSVDCDSCVTVVYRAPAVNADVKMREYPSIAFVDANTMIFCNGVSAFYVLERGVANTWTEKSSHCLAESLCMTDVCVGSDGGLSVLGYRSEIDLSGEIRKSRFITSLIKLTGTVVETLAQTESYTSPLYCKIQKGSESFIVASEHLNEIIKSPQTTTDTEYKVEHVVKAPLFQYNWTQTEDDITIYVNLSTPIEARFINSRFTTKYLHLSLLHPHQLTLFNSDTLLFDDIDPLESIWTLDDCTNITIYLAKKHAPFRWTQLFLNDDSVHESLDPTLLADYAARLDKFTSDDATPSDPHAHALTEKSEEIDLQGQSVGFVRCSLGKDGVSITHRNTAPGHEWLCASFTAPRICLGHDVDGIVYTLTPSFTFTHTHTFSALNFIKNSKTDKQFVCFTRDLRYAVVVEMRKYVFVYRREGSGESKSDQMMVDLDECGEVENVVGVQECFGGIVAVLRDRSVVLIKLA